MGHAVVSGLILQQLAEVGKGHALRREAEVLGIESISEGLPLLVFIVNVGTAARPLGPAPLLAVADAARRSGEAGHGRGEGNRGVTP